MRKFLILSAFFGGVAFVATSADAQVPPIPGVGAFGLLMNRGVQEELKITDQQKTNIIEVFKNMGAKYQNVRPELEKLPADEKKDILEKLSKELTEYVQK